MCDHLRKTLACFIFPFVHGGRRAVPMPNGSLKGFRKVCQYATEKRRCSAIVRSSMTFGGIVVFEGQRILGGWAFVGDLADFWKCGLHKFSV